MSIYLNVNIALLEILSPHILSLMFYHNIFLLFALLILIILIYDHSQSS